MLCCRHVHEILTYTETSLSELAQNTLQLFYTSPFHRSTQFQIALTVVQTWTPHFCVSAPTWLSSAGIASRTLPHRSASRMTFMTSGRDYIQFVAKLWHFPALHSQHFIYQLQFGQWHYVVLNSVVKLCNTLHSHLSSFSPFPLLSQLALSLR